MFYFGLDETGLINSHIFDRKVSNLKPNVAPKLPWLKARPLWSGDLLTGVATVETLATSLITPDHHVSDSFDS